MIAGRLVVDIVISPSRPSTPHRQLSADIRDDTRNSMLEGGSEPLADL